MTGLCGTTTTTLNEVVIVRLSTYAFLESREKTAKETHHTSHTEPRLKYDSIPTFPIYHHPKPIRIRNFRAVALRSKQLKRVLGSLGMCALPSPWAHLKYPVSNPFSWKLLCRWGAIPRPVLQSSLAAFLKVNHFRYLASLLRGFIVSVVPCYGSSLYLSRISLPSATRNRQKRTYLMGQVRPCSFVR